LGSCRGKEQRDQISLGCHYCYRRTAPPIVEEASFNADENVSFAALCPKGHRHRRRPTNLRGRLRRQLDPTRLEGSDLGRLGADLVSLLSVLPVGRHAAGFRPPLLIRPAPLATREDDCDQEDEDQPVSGPETSRKGELGVLDGIKGRRIALGEWAGGAL